MAQKRGPKSMSDQHKAALAVGRTQGRAVRRYLEALDANKPKRGRKRTPDTIQRRLAAIDEELTSADPLRSLNLRQERINLRDELGAMEQKVDLGALEGDFVVAAKEYGARKGISYDVWREAGVTAATLRKAGISRGAG